MDISKILMKLEMRSANLVDRIDELIDKGADKMNEVIVRLKDNRIKVKGGEYVRDLVRCKECRWFKKWKTIGRDDGYCEYARMTQDGLQYINTNADDYCSYGERREP